eukprot:6213011-Pleurochrysis_carterae.AAC.4
MLVVCGTQVVSSSIAQSWTETNKCVSFSLVRHLSHQHALLFEFTGADSNLPEKYNGKTSFLRMRAQAARKAGHAHI